MKKIFLFSLAFFYSASFFSCQTTNVKEGKSVAARFGTDNAVIVDLKNVSPINGGVFEGWGTSLCWWGNRLGGDEEISNKAADLFFSMDKGIGLNIIRYNIGGGDDPEHDHILRTDSAMPGFWKNVDEKGNFEYDWTADSRQRNLLKKIVSKVDEDELIVEFFSNSPPYFMTKSGCSSGGKPYFVTNIKDDMYEAFIEYLVEVTYQLQELDGIKVTSLEPMNEPSGNGWKAFNPKQEGCRVSKGVNQDNLLILTRQILDKRNLQNIIVSGCDEPGGATQMRSIRRLSSEAKSAMGRVNTHTYLKTKSKALLNFAIKNKKSLWVSETDGELSKGEGNGQMGPAIFFAEKIITDMNLFKPSAWVIWQAVAGYRDNVPFNGRFDGNGYPAFDQGFWGTAIADFIDEDILLSKKYYAFGQFTKFIRPGDYVVYTGLDNCIASYNPVSKRITIVYVNSNEIDEACSFDLSSSINGWGEIKAVRTSGMTLSDGENMEEVDCQTETLEPGVFRADIAPYSITTFIIEDVDMGEF